MARTLLIVLCLLASGARGEPEKSKLPDEAVRKEAILKDFYAAVEAVAQAHASDGYAEAMAFIQKGMEKAIVQSVIEASLLDPKPDAYEVRGILARRKELSPKRDPFRVSYRRLTCLFVSDEVWVPKKDPRRPAANLWERKPLTFVQKEFLWKRAGQTERRDAILAHYGRLFGKDMQAFREDCPRCKGDPHSPVNASGKSGALKPGDLDYFGSTCSSCLGVGVVVTVEFR